MKRLLIVKLSLALVIAMSATTWAQDEAQPSLSDSATNNMPPEPVVMDNNLGAACGCNQAIAAPMMVQPAVANCGGCATINNCGSCGTITNCATVPNCCSSNNCGCSSSCGDCGTIGQVGYDQIISASTPTTPTSIITTAPTPTTTFTQPAISSGCCGNTTYAPQSTINASVMTTNPTTTTIDPQYAPTTISQGYSYGNTCSNCTPSRRGFRRVFRRR